MEARVDQQLLILFSFASSASLDNITKPTNGIAMT